MSNLHLPCHLTKIILEEKLMDYVDVTKLVKEIESSKSELEYLECRYEKCTIGMQIMETCREIAKVLLVLKNGQDNIVEQDKCNMSEWAEEYLKRFSNSEEQNETAEAEREESSGYLLEVVQMVDDLEELLYERDTLMLRYFECLVRLQTMETHRTDIS